MVSLIDSIESALHDGFEMHEDIEAYEGRCETAKDGWQEYSHLYDLLAQAYSELRCAAEAEDDE